MTRFDDRAPGSPAPSGAGGRQQTPAPRGGWPAPPAQDGWPGQGAPAAQGGWPSQRPGSDDAWSPARVTSRATPVDGQWDPPGVGRSQPDWAAQAAASNPAPVWPSGGGYEAPSWQRPAWQALVIMLVITALGVIVDVLRDSTGGVDYAIVVASVVAIVVVRRLSMFPIVIAPPLVYLLGSAAVLYLRSGGPHNRQVLIDIATNWLVYGFPAMALATALVLVIAAIRVVAKR